MWKKKQPWLSEISGFILMSIFSLVPYRNMLESHRADNFSEMGLMHNKHNTLNTQSTTMAIIPQGRGSTEHFFI